MSGMRAKVMTAAMRAVVLFSLVVSGARLWSAGSEAWPAAGMVELELPPFAMVIRNDTTGDTWRQTGEASGNFIAVCEDFNVCLQKQGWKRAQAIPLSVENPAGTLSVWTRGAQRIILMIWERDLDTCIFMWGEDQPVASGSVTNNSVPFRNQI